MNTREKFLAELKAKKEAARTAEAEALSQANAQKAAEQKESDERIAAKIKRLAGGDEVKKPKAKKTTAKQTTKKTRGRPKKAS